MDASLEVVHLDHCSVLITDVERSRRFYRDILRLKEIHKPRTFQFTVIWFELGDETLHLLLKDKPDSISPRHFALRVVDAQAARRWMHQREVAIEETVVIPGADRFFIHDPDGNRIEIIQWLRSYRSEDNAPPGAGAYP